jgi:hypothetical protein
MFVKKVVMNVPRDINLNYVNNLRIEQTFDKAPDGCRIKTKDDMTVEFSIILLLCEGHWGVQRVFSNNWMVNFHIGLGRAFDFTTKGSSNYMAFGLKVAYFIRKMK